MHHINVARGLPALLLLMAVAVILILSGASGVGLALGLVVAATAGLMLVSMLIYEVAHSAPAPPRRESLAYRAPRRRL